MITIQSTENLDSPHSESCATFRRYLENAAIRKAVLRAAAHEQRKAEFNLSGRGHEPRVTLDHSIAAVLRGLDVPQVFVRYPGSWGNRYFPRRVFARAKRSLKRKFGRSPIALTSSRRWPRVYRVYDMTPNVIP